MRNIIAALILLVSTAAYAEISDRIRLGNGQWFRVGDTYAVVTQGCALRYTNSDGVAEGHAFVPHEGAQFALNMTGVAVLCKGGTLTIAPSPSLVLLTNRPNQ